MTRNICTERSRKYYVFKLGFMFLPTAAVMFSSYQGILVLSIDVWNFGSLLIRTGSNEL
jgi:hypothetical protein